MVFVAAGSALALFFRFYQLDTVPLEMFSDHAEKLQDVQDVLKGDTRIFFPRNTGREFFQMYLTALTAKYLGYGLSFMALKMGTALAGTITIPFIYLLGKELANRRVGLMAMVMAGMSYWLNVVTRVALRFSLYPLFVAPTLFFVVRGLRRGNRNDFIWAGIFLGIGLHGYSPFRFVPLLVALAVVLFVLHVRSSEKQAQALWHLGVVIAVSFVIFLPLLRFMTESEANSSIVFYRSLTRLTSFESPFPDNPVKIFANNMWLSMAMFAWENGNTWVHSVIFRPALDVVSGAFFYLGYILLLIRYFRQRNWEDIFLILSVPFLMLPSALSLAFPSENPSLNRSGGSIIPVFIIAAMPLDGLFSSVRRWIGSEWGRVAGASVVGILLLWSSFANYDLVFRQYNEQYKLSSWNTTELGSVIRGFANSYGSEDSAWVVPYAHWVDTRLVGSNAGVYIKDYALQRDNLGQTTQITGPKLFLFNVEDDITKDMLRDIYPDGRLTMFDSESPGKDFMIFFANTPDPSRP
jgi:4-amino-4-deoxy-L-arabinose transferase-like glycosyltransferase